MILDTNAMMAPSREQSKRHDNNIFKREEENPARVEGHYRGDDVHQIDSLRKLFRLTGSLYLCTDFDHRSKQRAADDRCVKIRWRRLSILLAETD